MTTCRLITLADAPALAAVLQANREFMTPFEPLRGDGYFTVEGQRTSIGSMLAEHAAGRALPLVILDGAGAVAGRITLTGIVRGAFLSGSVGYWVSRPLNGRGLATAALGEITRLAFADLGLHRLQAETLLANVASQRVLERNGFTRIGLAPGYLKIAGRWQDMIIFQLLNDAVE